MENMEKTVESDLSRQTRGLRPKVQVKFRGAAPPPPPPPPPSEGASSSQISDILDALVSSGTLTSEQLNAVSSAAT